MRLVEQLRAAGTLPAAWQHAIETVDRKRFIPDRVWFEDNGEYVAVERSTDPAGWHAAVETDQVIVTQFDDGATPWPAVGYRPSCSSSMPSTMLGMLDALDLRDGDRVLEIGTGTGYNSALLATRAKSVTTIEIDPAVAEHARIALANTQSVQVITADGSSGCPDHGPFDRVVVTAAVRIGQLPHAWVQQTMPGGVLVVPVRTDLASGPLVRLDIAPDGSASGFAVPMRVGFMELRGHRTPSRWDRLRWDDPAGVLSYTEVQPWSALLNEHSRWAIAVALPQCKYTVWERTADRPHGVAWLVDTCSGSWASVVPALTEGLYEVRQHGPRRLWDEAETAYLWWLDQGQPPIERWRFTITPDQQTVALP